MKKGQFQLLANPYVLIGLAVIVGGILLWSHFQRETVYPHVKSKYDFEDVHLYHFENIVSLYPDGKIDQRDYVEDRPYQFIVAHLIMYDNTKDMKYLDRAVTNMRIFESRCQTDSDGDGWLDCKGYYTYDGTHRTAGWIADLFARASWIVQKNNVEKYADDAARWAQLVDDEFFPYFEQTWHPYEVEGEKLGYYDKNDRGIAQQFNRVAGIGSAYIWRWKATGDDKYKDVPQRMLNRFFNERVNPRYTSPGGLTYFQSLYSWYDPLSGETWYCDPEGGAQNDYLCDGLTDDVHLNYEFDFIMSGYESGLISKDELDLVSSSIRVMMGSAGEGKVGDKSTPLLNHNMGPPRKMFLDEADTNNVYRQTGHMYNFIRIGAVDEELVYDMEEILHNNELAGQLNGNYFSSYYRCVKDPQNNFAEFCQEYESRVEDMEVLLGIANLGRFQ